jgi:mannose-1-phosphate guanylyltransferase/mannose-1-phosphate guanylyltransferase/mannose-6-phosphate isomerase
MPSSGRLVPVILSGGSGTRLWPLSRGQHPKQLLPLVSERSLLQDTVLRASGEGFADPVVVCSADHRFIIAEQLRELDITPRAMLLEPVARNTAAAVAAAAEVLMADDPDALMVVLPSDHVIDDGPAFVKELELAADAARTGRLALLGIRPNRPDTGFGYIRQGAPLEGCPEAFAVEGFVEKPALEVAEQFVASGEWAWNSGMFVFSPRLYLEELARFEPQTAAAVSTAVARSRHDLDFIRLDEDSFADAVSISIDYAVMERTDRAAVVPARLAWSDVGSWAALWELGAQDSAGNVVHGDVMAVDAHGCYLRSSQPLVAALGVEDLIVVATDDVVLVADKSRGQDVKALVDVLKENDRAEASVHRTVYRPWGHYTGIDLGETHQVKHLAVKPGQRLSLQTHAHRAEHWIVVSGTAHATRGDEEITLTECMSIDIPVGCAHRLANRGPEWLHVIEIQTGDYLGEDDIVRLDDVYGRCEPDPEA